MTAFKFFEIVTNENCARNVWFSEKQSQHKPKEFLNVLAPALDQILLLLEAQRLEHPILQSLISKAFLKKWLKQDAQQLILPIIARTMALELASASQGSYLSGDTPNARFDCFILEMMKPNNARDFFQKYQPLTQLLTTVFTNHLNYSCKLLNELAHDWPAINKELLPGEHWQLSDIQGAGDTHCQGQRVAIFEFRHQQHHKKIVYKPRNLSIDLAWQQLLTWFNHNQRTINLYNYKILNCNDHGWCEFVSYEPCHNESDIAYFYQSCGALLALMHLLNGNDIHIENLIAHGKHPVIVDLECLCKPYLVKRPLDEKFVALPHVLESLILPYRTMISDDYAGFDISAIGGRGGEEAPYKRMEWENPGTDEMRIVRNSVKLLSKQNIPTCDGKIVSPLNHQGTLTKGFVDTYRVLIKHKPYLLSKHSPLQHFKPQTIRILFRATADYAKLLHESYHPKLLYSITARKAHFNWLRTIVPYFPTYQQILRHEIKDLMHNDIPFFSARCDSKKIFDSRGNVLKFPAKKSGWQCVQTHLKNTMNEKNLALQCRLIESSFTAAHMNQHHGILPTPSFPKLKQQAATYFKPRAKKIAKKILDDLLHYKIENNFQIYWPTLKMVQENIWNPDFTNLDLYNGMSGLMLSYLFGYQLLKDKRYLAVVKKCLLYLETAIRFHNPKLALNVSPLNQSGAFSGIGGILYALTLCYQVTHWTKCKTLVTHCLAFCKRIIKQDLNFDIIAGNAGLLKCLLNVYHVFHNDEALQLAKLAARCILKNFPDPSQVPASLSDVASQPLLGFSHGVTGIAWALAALHALAPQKAYQFWIKHALAYEDEFYHPQQQNWPDFRNNVDKINRPRFASAWCHGAPGIGMARLTLPSVWQSEDVQHDIHHAIQHTLHTLKNFDGSLGLCLCHGYLGNLDLLLIARDKKIALNNNEYEHLINQIFTCLETTSFENYLQGRGMIPGLLLGTAGIAYQVLRIAYPEQVPSVLTLSCNI